MLMLLADSQHVTLAVVGLIAQQAAVATPIQRDPETRYAKHCTIPTVTRNTPRSAARQPVHEPSPWVQSQKRRFLAGRKWP
jgi:hypothetical protein